MSKEIRILQRQAWERAKGELLSVVFAFTFESQEAYDEIETKIQNFIEDMEDASPLA